MTFLTAEVKIGVDDKGLPQQLNKAKRLVTSMVGKVTASFKRMAQSFKAAFDKMVKYAKWGALAIAGGMALVSRAAMKQEDAVFLLGAALKAAGDFSVGAMNKFKAFAASIQQATIYGDEEILSLMQLMKSLGVTSASLEKATKMAIGLAAATGRDVQSMSMYIALAQQGEFTMLRRYIPALRSTTDATEQLRIITDFAAKGFKIAEAQAETTSGALKQMWNVIGDVAEVIGFALLPTIKDAAKGMKKWAEDNQKSIGEWAQVFVDKIEIVIEKLKDLWAVFSGEGFSAGMKTIFKALVPVFEAIVDSFVIIGLAAGRAFTRAFGEEIGRFFVELGKPDGVLGKLSMAIPAIGVPRLALMKAGLDMIESARLEEPIKAAEKLREILKGVSASMAEAIPARPAEMIPYVATFLEPRVFEPATGGVAADALVNFKQINEGIIEDQKRTDAILIGMAEERAAYEIGQRAAVADATIEAAEKASDAKDRLNDKQMKQARAGIEQIQSLNFLSHTERLDQMDELIERKREIWAEEGEAMALLNDERERYADQHKEGLDALRQTMDIWFQDASNWGKNLGDVLVNAFDRAADSFADMLMRQKMDWKAFGAMFVHELLAMIIKLQIAMVLKAALQGWSGLFPSMGQTGTGGTGAVTPGITESLDTGFASGGHVLETGIAKVHKGEEIIPAGAGGLTINIENNAGVQVDIEENPDERTVNVILTALAGDGPMRRAVSGIRR